MATGLYGSDRFLEEDFGKKVNLDLDVRIDMHGELIRFICI